jgi:hypothetical protein
MQNSKNEQPDLSRTGLIRGVNAQLLWACAIVGLIAALAVIWIFGVNLWTSIVFILLIGCPAAIGWLLVIDQQSTTRRKP